MPTTSYPTTLLWLQDIEKELFLQSTLFNIAQDVAKQTGFTDGDRPEDNNAFITSEDVVTFFIDADGFFAEWRAKGLLDTKDTSIDVSNTSLVVSFDNQNESILISYRAILSRSLREFTIVAIYGKGA